MKSLEKKGGSFGQLASLGLGIATLVIILAMTFLILAQTGDQAATTAGYTNLTSCISGSCNATKTLTTATATLPAWVPIIILIAVAGVILAMVAVFGSKS